MPLGGKSEGFILSMNWTGWNSDRSWRFENNSTSLIHADAISNKRVSELLE
jgi:hypothetical protein